MQALQGGFSVPPSAPIAQHPYDAGVPAMDPSYGLPPAVAQAAQTGFAPIPVGVNDGLGAPGAPQYVPPPFHPHALANPFPDVGGLAAQGFHQGALPPSKDDVAAIKADTKAQAADAARAKAQAAYAGTPLGQLDTAANTELGANADQQAIAKAQGDVAAKQAEEQAAIRDKAIVDQQQLAAKQDQARQEQFAQQQQMLAERAKAVEAANKRVVDPNRLYNSQSTGQHIGTAMMMILSGFGQGLAGDNKENAVMKMVGQAIDRDIDAQKANIEQGNKGVEMKRQLAQDYGHLGDDINTQFEYRRAQGRLLAADQLEAAAGHYNAPQKLLAAQQAAAVLRGQAGTIIGAAAERKLAQQNEEARLANARAQIGIAGYHASIADRAQRAQEHQFGITTAREIMKDDADNATKLALAQAKKAGSDAPIQVATGIDDKGAPVYKPLMNQGGIPYGAGLEKEQVAKAQEMYGETRVFVDAADKIRQMREDTGGHINSHSEGARAMAQEMARLVLSSHKLAGIRFTKEAMDLANKAITGDEDADTVDSFFKTVTPEIETARNDQITNFKMKLPNFTGDPRQLDFPDPVKKKPSTSTNSDFMKAMEERPGVDGALGRTIARATGMSEKQKFFIRTALDAIHGTPTQRLSGQTPDPKARENAIALVKQVAEDSAATSEVRKRAQEIIDQIYGKQTPAED